MRFIKDIQAVEENGGNRYRDFVVINTVIFQKMILFILKINFKNYI
jgi:hypothetical protein